MKNCLKKNFYIKSLGCKTNQAEGQLIADILTLGGYKEVSDIKDCNIYILNSCSVTAHSDSQALYLIKNARKQNPSVKIILTGCMAQTADDKESINADLILGNDEKLDILDYIQKVYDTKNVIVNDIFSVKNFKHRMIKNPSSTRVSVKIQDGCNNRCSYCLIPYARGNSRSNSVDNIIEQINYLASKGYKEVILTGIHIGEWGHDFNDNILTLLKETEKTNILRYRLGSLYTDEITDDMINFLVSSEKFCPHFHLSIQSLCNETLKRMNRKYTKESVTDLIKSLKAAFKLPFIGCDIITGFPGESDDDFLETYNALKMSEVSYIHSFPYSERKGTPAAVMDGVVELSQRHERTKKLIQLSKDLHNKFLCANKNTDAEVLYQKKSQETGMYPGITRNYIKVYKKSVDNLRNTVETVNLSSFDTLY